MMKIPKEFSLKSAKVSLAMLLVLCFFLGLVVPILWGANRTALSTGLATWLGSAGSIVITAIGSYLVYLMTTKQNRIIAKQNKIIHRQTNIELFDKRYEIYEFTTRFLLNLRISTGIPSPEDYDLLAFTVLKSTFLFDTDVSNVLKELQNNITRLRVIDNDYKTKIYSVPLHRILEKKFADNTPRNIIDEDKRLRTSVDLNDLRNLFDRYLNFRKLTVD